MSSEAEPAGAAGPPPGSPILSDKFFDIASAFTPESLLREARRQKNVEYAAVPDVCILDPDGDIVDHLIQGGRAEQDQVWVCYHTDLFRFTEAGREFGIVGHAVGAPFAVLVAEQLFASGCRLLISMTSAGQLRPVRPPPYFVLIDQALRDEGVSHHYLPPSRFSQADDGLLSRALQALEGADPSVVSGASWTTDAPYRETPQCISLRTAEGLLAVEMEAAGLYAFGKARSKAVLCFAHVTNQMGQAGDFEKGEAGGAAASLAVILATAGALVPTAAEEALPPIG